jgi:tRNA 2-selenouridine synthase
MTERVQAAEFAALLGADTPWIDVRAEVEFGRGHLPGSLNLPILRDEEREQVGTCYKKRGQQAAVELGHALVSGELREQRIAAWCEAARARPGTHLFCWRGGMRSRLAADWMFAAGVSVPVVEGGYKALRARLLTELEGLQPREPWVVVGGRTGSAKTALVQALPGGIDLEAHARHRGSSFGRRAGRPPAQADFENALALDLLRRRRSAPGAVIFLEDESRQIGAITIPQDLHRAMREAPRVVLEVSLEERIERILQDYIRTDLADHLALDPMDGFGSFARQLTESLFRIRRRLGDARYRDAGELLGAALAAQRERGEIGGHRAWIALLLREYYDPMYDYQLGQSAAKVVFRGDTAAVREWCLSRGAHAPD